MCDLGLILPFTIVEVFTKHNIIYPALFLICISSFCVPYVDRFLLIVLFWLPLRYSLTLIYRYRIPTKLTIYHAVNSRCFQFSNSLQNVKRNLSIIPLLTEPYISHP